MAEATPTGNGAVGKILKITPISINITPTDIALYNKLLIMI